MRNISRRVRGKEEEEAGRRGRRRDRKLRGTGESVRWKLGKRKNSGRVWMEEWFVMWNWTRWKRLVYIARKGCTNEGEADEREREKQEDGVKQVKGKGEEGPTIRRVR